MIYTNTATPAVTYNGSGSGDNSSAAGLCQAVGRTPIQSTIAAATGTAGALAVLSACGVPAGTYFYTATPAYTGNENGYCTFGVVGPLGTISYSTNTWACASPGMGALVICS